jgi:hypothetical protein
MVIAQVAVIAFAAVLGGLMAHWAVERQRLRRFVQSFRVLPADPRCLALEVAGRLFTRPQCDSDPPYLVKALAPLGATASALIERGGCCSGMSRLYILCLSQLEIRAHQITLYHRTGRAQHCLVEVRLPDGPLIADPVYGLYYTDETGRPIDLDRLQTGATPRFASLPHSDRIAYPSDSYYEFAFTRSKTANWTKSWCRRQAYRFLTAVTRGGIDRLRLPAILEWPQVLLGAILTITIGAMQVLVWVFR